MSHVSKRLKEAKGLLDKTKVYTLAEAIKLVKDTSKVKFDASVEVHLKLGIDPKKGEQGVRASIVLPFGTGKIKKVAVFVTPTYEKEAKTAGADIVGGKDLIEQIKKDGKCDFEVAVAVPEIMRDLAAIAKTLGQKGLMPNPKTGTVTTDITKAVEEIKKGKVDFKNDDTANIHAMVGKVSFTDEQIKANIDALINAVKKAKPDAVKGIYLKTMTICSSMGPGIKVQL
ncbi:MAG: 50S ribosomal protein L1 [Patescibacteria group bacterium]